MQTTYSLNAAATVVNLTILMFAKTEKPLKDVVQNKQSVLFFDYWLETSAAAYQWRPCSFCTHCSAYARTIMFVYVTSLISDVCKETKKEHLCKGSAKSQPEETKDEQLSIGTFTNIISFPEDNAH